MPLGRYGYVRPSDVGPASQRVRSPESSRIIGCERRSSVVYTGVPSPPYGTRRNVRGSQTSVYTMSCQHNIPTRAADSPRFIHGEISAMLPLSKTQPL